MEVSLPAYPGHLGYPRSRVLCLGLGIVKIKSVYMTNGLETGWKRASPGTLDPGSETEISGVRAVYFPM